VSEPVVYVDGRFVECSRAAVSIEDRGYQFGDGVYEVARVYDGRPFKMREHLDRLARSARAIRMDLRGLDSLERDALELLHLNGWGNRDLYIQATRGACPRSHCFPRDLEPVVVMTAREAHPYPPALRRQGVAAITLSDDRWARCYIKSISLLSNVLAKQKARDEGAFEAIYIRDGFMSEGSSTNVFIVEGDSLVTPPLTNYILPGITRATVIGLATGCGIPVAEESVSRERLLVADEVFLTGTTTEVMPVVTVDGVRIGCGAPGRTALRLFEQYMRLVTG